MCGINGIIVRETKSDLLPLIHRMNDTLKHRGPDGEGTFIHTKIALGHRRLSIIDLSDNAKQPMHYLDRYVITFNGEIFNYIELREELKNAGYSFHTASDTEVLIAAYDMWGPECLRRFNGMWAFVLYDRKYERVFIGRDRFGIKPLYYYSDSENFIFSSEIKALLVHPAVSPVPSIDYCLMFTELGSKEWIAETAFQNVYRFLQANYIECSCAELFDKPLNYKGYWQLNTNLSKEKFNRKKADRFSEQYRYLLKDAVRLRLRADVKVGSALSGGIDSSSIVKLVNECLDETNSHHDNQLTFSSIYTSTKEVRYCDESSYIKTLSEYLKVRSYMTEPKLEDVIEIQKKITYHMDTPHEGTLVSAWYVYKLAAENGVKVTLDGQGADEQLGGYSSYSKLFVAAARNPIREYLMLSSIPGIRSSINQGLVISLLRKTLSKKTAHYLFEKYKLNKIYLKSLNEKLVTDTLESLTHHLHFGDRLSMAHSIESRVPFLDYRFVEFAASIPDCYKIHNGWTKFIAREAMQSSLPANILWRKDKMGFPVPEKYWFNGPLRNWMIKEINSSIFINELGYNNVSTDSYPMSKLVRLLNTALWYKCFILNSSKC